MKSQYMSENIGKDDEKVGEMFLGEKISLCILPGNPTGIYCLLNRFVV